VPAAAVVPQDSVFVRLASAAARALETPGVGLDDAALVARAIGHLLALGDRRVEGDLRRAELRHHDDLVRVPSRTGRGAHRRFSSSISRR
jgi:hypothetical protein